MYEIKKQKNIGNYGNVGSNSNYLGRVITSFILFMSISVGFGFLIGHFVLPKSCTNCKTIIEEMRTDGNAYIDFVSGTEYIANIGGLDEGQVIIRITDYRGNPLNASCNATIFNPDKTYYITDKMMNQSTLLGNYYTTFSIPTTTGVFTDYVNCSVQLGGRTLYASKSSSFHVSPILNLFNNISTQIGQLNQTVVDGDNMLNDTINYVHIDILNNLNNTEYTINSTLTQIIDDMSTYYSNLAMMIDNVTSTVISSKIEIINAIETTRSDIEIIKEWLGYMFGKIAPTTLEEGQSWIDKIVGKDVELPDWMIPRPD